MPDDPREARPVPAPPFELAHRVTAIDPESAAETYRVHGQDVRDMIVSLLPSDWSFDEKRILDFGCGAGRVMSAFVEEARVADFHGCDIDADSVRWVEENLVPPFRVFATSTTPEPLPFDDQSVDLIYAVSVFSHLADGWSGWLAELHRCLAPTGLFLATFLGEASSETIAGEPWDPDRVGMNVLFPHQPWDRGGPMVFVSRWWLEARWGRAFEFERYLPALHPAYQDWAVLRRRPVPATAALFEEPEPGEVREVHALRHNISQLRREYEATERALRATLDGVVSSASWKLTRPLRWLKRLFRPGGSSDLRA